MFEAERAADEPRKGQVNFEHELVDSFSQKSEIINRLGPARLRTL